MRAQTQTEHRHVPRRLGARPRRHLVAPQIGVLRATETISLLGAEAVYLAAVEECNDEVGGIVLRDQLWRDDVHQPGWPLETDEADVVLRRSDDGPGQRLGIVPRLLGQPLSTEARLAEAPTRHRAPEVPVITLRSELVRPRSQAPVQLPIESDEVDRAESLELLAGDSQAHGMRQRPAVR
jgi:hypothetical protein